jgi:hypothetical protein
MNIELKSQLNTTFALGRQFALVPDPARSATNLLIRIDVEISEDANARAAFESLLKSLDRGKASIVVVTSKRSASSTEQFLKSVNFDESRYHIYPIENDRFSDFQHWPRDILIWGAVPPSGAWAVIQIDNSTAAGSLDEWIIDHFQTGRFDRDRIGLDGGDSLVVDDKYWIVGDGSVCRMMDTASTGTAWKKILRTIRRKMEMKPIAVGIGPDDTGDLSLGARWTLSQLRATSLRARERHGLTPTRFAALRQSLSDHFMASFSFLRSLWDPRVNLNWSHADMVVAVTGATTLEGSPIVLVAETTAKGCPQSRAARHLEEVLGHMADQLKAAGLEVMRNPAPFCSDYDLILPYNNVIVQTDPKVVWLPTFASDGAATKSVDDSNIQIWKNLEFEVIEVPRWFQYVRWQRGCIRCATLPVPFTPTYD